MINKRVIESIVAFSLIVGSLCGVGLTFGWLLSLFLFLLLWGNNLGQQNRGTRK